MHRSQGMKLPPKPIQPNIPISHLPSKWKEAYTLHKKGPKKDPANYRPISITRCFGKLFTGILNTCLMQFMADTKISHPFQGTFTKGRRDLKKAHSFGHVWTRTQILQTGRKHLRPNNCPNQSRIHTRTTIHIKCGPLPG